MIIVQTPLRISFLGGGTDFRDFYLREDGCVISSAIDKYIYVIIKERFDDKIYVNYSKKEIVDNVDSLQHELVREAMRITGVKKGVEITTLADVPSEGTGLGSSGSVTVGLLHALYTYQGVIKPPEVLAAEAAHIEIDILAKPIGKQDQYIVTFGNLRFTWFRGNSDVEVETIELGDQVRRKLEQNLMLFFTGITRRSSVILTEQRENISQNFPILHQLKLLATEAKNCIIQGDFDRFGELMHQGWEYKKQLASKITNSGIDEMYRLAREAGAIGGKITGAGGGGFLLLYCPMSKQDQVRATLGHLQELPFRLERDGTKVIFNYRR